MDKPNFCESIHKGKNEEEIKRGLNQKWIEIINSCVFKGFPTTDYQNSDKHSITTISKNQTCSANLNQRGAE